METSYAYFENADFRRSRLVLCLVNKNGNQWRHLPLPVLLRDYPPNADSAGGRRGQQWCRTRQGAGLGDGRVPRRQSRTAQSLGGRRGHREEEAGQWLVGGTDTGNTKLN